MVKMVEINGIEPMTYCLQSNRYYQLSYTPKITQTYSTVTLYISQLLTSYYTVLQTDFHCIFQAITLNEFSTINQIVVVCFCKW